MSNTHSGLILEIRDKQDISDKFEKREFVVDEVFTGKYGESHNPVVFTLAQEKCSLIDQFKVGDHITVHYDLESRPWLDKDTKEHRLNRDGNLAYFLSVKAWKLEPRAEEAPQADTGTTSAGSATQPPVSQADSPGRNTQGFDNSQMPPESGAAGDDNGPDDMPF